MACLGSAGKLRTGKNTHKTLGNFVTKYPLVFLDLKSASNSEWFIWLLNSRNYIHEIQGNTLTDETDLNNKKSVEKEDSKEDESKVKLWIPTKNARVYHVNCSPVERDEWWRWEQASVCRRRKQKSIWASVETPLGFAKAIPTSRRILISFWRGHASV